MTLLPSETGLLLENEAIDFFDKHLAGATDPTEREFLERMVAEEKQHLWLLADLKFYYEDTEKLVPRKGPPDPGWARERGHSSLTSLQPLAANGRMGWLKRKGATHPPPIHLPR